MPHNYCTDAQKPVRLSFLNSSNQCITREVRRLNQSYNILLENSTYYST